jgi:DNA-binding response OmpR family regulator
MHVLVVEDEKKMATSLKQGLEQDNHSVGLAFDGHDALEMAQSLEYDAIVLKIMLPGMDGFEVTRRLRKTGNKTPILILSARNTVSDIVKSLDIGADDFMTKPFYFEEFLARLRSVSRCATVQLPLPLRVGELILNPASHEASRAGKSLSLSPTEYRLLEFLMRRAGRVVPNRAIVQFVWNSIDTFDMNTLHAYIKQLRSKVDRGHKIKLIETARGFGYGVVNPASQ